MMPSNILAQRFGSAPPMANGLPAQPGIMAPGMPQGVQPMAPRPIVQPMPGQIAQESPGMAQAQPQNFLAPRPQLAPPMQAMRPGMLPQNAMRQRMGVM